MFSRRFIEPNQSLAIILQDFPKKSKKLCEWGFTSDKQYRNVWLSKQTHLTEQNND